MNLSLQSVWLLLLFATTAYIPNVQCDDCSPLFRAIKRSDETLVRQLLASGADASQTCGEDGETALIMAASKNNLEMVKILLPESDATATDSLGYTALMMAAYNNNTEMVKLLLPKSDVKATNKWGQSALDLATDNEVIRLIQQYI